MAVAKCIPELVAEGKIGGKRAEDATRRYNRHLGALADTMSPDAAAAEASQRVLAELEREVAQKKRRSLLQVAAQQRMREDMASFTGDPLKAAAAMLAADDRAPFMNVEAQTAAIRGRAHKLIEGVLRKHSRNILGEARDKSGLIDVVRELHGEKTGNTSARELADGFAKAAEMLRERFNRAGGDIAQLANWGMPHAHDMMKVRAVSFDQWKADILPGLDLARMVDGETGGRFTPDALEQALREAYDAIRSDGWSRREAGSGGRSASAASARQKHRFFQFVDADAWLAYHGKYGTGTPFDAMVGHVDVMARDIALMERLGPNPEASVQWLKEHVARAAALDETPGMGPLDRARSAEDKVQRIFEVVSGQLNSPVNETWARRLGGVRSFLTSAFLGSASISAISDAGFQRLTRLYNGLPATRVLVGYLKLLNPFDAADRRLAVRLGLQATEAAQQAASLARFTDGAHGPEVMMRMADAVLRISGLNAWTQAGRWDFGMSVLGAIRDLHKSGWEELDAGFRGMLSRYGIDAGEWDAIRAAEPYRERGGEWFDVDAVPQALGDKVLRMALTETDFAVPSAGARAKATLSFGQRPGTIGGELLRNMFLFKSFGVSMVMTHGARGLAQTGANRAAYFARLTVYTTLLGALAVQLREIAQGRDPQAMDNGDFWKRAMLQGGGYGIFGDFFQSLEGVDRYGRGPVEALAGPVVSAGVDILKAGKKVIGASAEDSDVTVGEEAGRQGVRLADRYTPGASSLWWARAAWERMVLDQLQMEVDPDYASSWDRLETRRLNEQGQEYWWAPGEVMPERAPEMSEGPPPE